MRVTGVLDVIDTPYSRTKRHNTVTRYVPSKQVYKEGPPAVPVNWNHKLSDMCGSRIKHTHSTILSNHVRIKTPTIFTTNSTLTAYHSYHTAKYTLFLTFRSN